MYLLHHLLTQSAGTSPTNIAVVFKEQSLSYHELDDTSSRLCGTLISHGVQPGDRIGILLNKSLESIVSVFGILKAGAIYVPLDPTAPTARLSAIINHCGIGFLITSADHLTRLFTDMADPLAVHNAIVAGPEGGINPDLIPDVKCLDWSDACSGSAGLPVPSLTDAAPAYILHTSGSTGLPKGVVISHLNALSFVNMATRFFGITEEDRLANHAPLHFDLSIFDIFCAVRAGAAVVIAPEYLSAFPVRLAEFIDQQKITVWNSVASVLTKLADQGALERLKFDSLRLVHFSGDLMPVKYLQLLKKRMPAAEFYNIYGQTEANSSLYFKVPEQIEDETWKIPIGRPFPNFDVFAVTEGGELVTRTDQEGELHVLSSTVALGYWNDPKRTAEQFTSDPRTPWGQAKVYRTGDMVRRDAAGNFVFSGRKDHMVKSKGFRVELDEIEIVLNSHPKIRQAVVVAVPDDLTGNRIVAYITPKEGIEVATKELLELCSNHLPKYMMPETIQYRDTLPTTSNEKINRKALVQEFLGLV
jgi:amino acid adenylation domain-containing protein